MATGNVSKMIRQLVKQYFIVGYLNPIRTVATLNLVANALGPQLDTLITGHAIHTITEIPRPDPNPKAFAPKPEWDSVSPRNYLTPLSYTYDQSCTG